MFIVIAVCVVRLHAEYYKEMDMKVIISQVDIDYMSQL